MRKFFIAMISLTAIGCGILQAQEAVSSATLPNRAMQDLSYTSAVPVTHTNSGQTVNANGDATGEVSAVPRRFQYAVRASFRSVYDDNIFLTNRQPIHDFYFAIEPGITVGFGDIVGGANYIRLDYAPSIFVYADNSAADAFQHLMRLEGRYGLGHLSLGLTQDILLLEGTNPSSISSGPNTTPSVNLDAVGAASNTYTTTATLSYDLTGKIFLSGGVHSTVSDYETLISSWTLSGDLFINYNYSPKLVIGLGGTAGYNPVEDPSPDQTFEQINGRASYQVSGKVSLNASFGLEIRQYEDDARGGNYLSPVYDLTASYQPFDGTTLSLSGTRQTKNSAVLVGQDYASTTITVSGRQRFLRKIYFSFTVGYENSTYFNTIQSIDASRKDDYFFMQPAVDVTLTELWTVGAYFFHRQSDSSSDVFSFHDNQVGVRTSIAF